MGSCSGLYGSLGCRVRTDPPSKDILLRIGKSTCMCTHMHACISTYIDLYPAVDLSELPLTNHNLSMHACRGGKAALAGQSSRPYRSR